MHEWGDSLPVLSATRVVLRPLGKRDLDRLFSLFSDPEVIRYWGTPPLASRSAAVELLAQINDGFRTRRLFQWCISDRETNELIGTCTLNRLDRYHQRAEIGFAVTRSRWRKGYATEAVERLLEFAFETLELRRVEADADPRNTASLALLERQGFEREGYLRERYVQLGEVQDAVVLGLLRSDWRARKRDRGHK